MTEVGLREELGAFNPLPSLPPRLKSRGTPLTSGRPRPVHNIHILVVSRHMGYVLVREVTEEQLLQKSFCSIVEHDPRQHSNYRSQQLTAGGHINKLLPNLMVLQKGAI